jgi:septal ring factor EnvC (AmiA/AmiB activator)
MIARTARPVAAKLSGSSLPRSWLKFLQRELERLREKLKDRSERIAELEKQVQEKEKELADAQKKIAEQGKQIAEQEKQITEQEKQITEQEKQISDLERQLALRQRNSTIIIPPSHLPPMGWPGPNDRGAAIRKRKPRAAAKREGKRDIPATSAR